jgi:pilus assembly protein CpaF
MSNLLEQEETNWDEDEIEEVDSQVVDSEFSQLRDKIHHQVLEVLDLSVVSQLSPEQLRQELKNLVIRIVNQQDHPLTSDEREKLVSQIQHEVLGLGPLESLLADVTVNDILVNGASQVFVERSGKLERSSVKFRDEAHLRKVIEKIVSAIGRRIDESSPMVDARLADGSRVNAIIPPLALDGSSVSIRKFTKDKLVVEDLIAKQSMIPQMGDLLRAVVEARLNVVIAGGTGCGKTTLLNILSGFIPDDERIVTIEDAAELQLRQEHVVRLETRPPNIEGKGEVNQRDLVKNSLRMRPDRIVMGEVRGGETLDMLQAMNTGHDGSLTTIHANSPRDALTRVETLVALAGLNISTKALRHYISSALDVIVQSARLSDGSRKIISIQEITGMEGEIITLQELFTFEQTGLDENRKVHGIFKATGIRPKFIEKFTALGIELPFELFDPYDYVEC